MAIIVPPPLDLAFTIYGLPWPDIDEDKVGEFGERFDNLCEATAEFGRAVDGLLEALSSAADSEAFTAITSQWKTACNRDVFPVIDGIGEAVRVSADTGRNIITSYKATLIAFLTANIAVDLAAMAVPGPGTAAAAARAATMRIIVRQFAVEAAKMFAGLVVEQINKAFEEFVLRPLEQMFSAIREQIVVELAAHISSNSLVRRGTMRTAGALYIDFSDVIDAISNLQKASDGLRTALHDYLGQAGSDDLSEPNVNAAPERDSILRIEVEDVLRWSLHALVTFLTDIAHQVVSDLTKLILDTYAKYVEADQTLAAQARALQDRIRSSPRPTSFVIDRSTRPRPIRVWENPPEEVFTGEAVSQARLNIKIIDMPEDPEPVITGAAVSEARFNIEIIDLPDAPDPVRTGVAASDASAHIPRIELPDLRVTSGEAARE